MEEQVGALWHRLVTRLAETRYRANVAAMEAWAAEESITAF